MRVGGVEKAPKGYCSLAGLGRDKGYLYHDRAFWFCVTTVDFVLQHELVFAGCSWVAVMVSLYHDRGSLVVTETVTMRG